MAFAGFPQPCLGSIRLRTGGGGVEKSPHEARISPLASWSLGSDALGNNHVSTFRCPQLIMNFERLNEREVNHRCFHHASKCHNRIQVRRMPSWVSRNEHDGLARFRGLKQMSGTSFCRYTRVLTYSRLTMDIPASRTYATYAAGSISARRPLSSRRATMSTTELGG